MLTKHQGVEVRQRISSIRSAGTVGWLLVTPLSPIVHRLGVRELPGKGILE